MIYFVYLRGRVIVFAFPDLFIPENRTYEHAGVFYESKDKVQRKTSTNND